MTYPNQNTQEDRVLQVLLKANGTWVNKQYFVRDLYLTQAGRAIHNLENRFGWKIEHSDFTDQFGFKSYRIVQDKQQSIFELSPAK